MESVAFLQLQYGADRALMIQGQKYPDYPYLHITENCWEVEGRLLKFKPGCNLKESIIPLINGRVSKDHWTAFTQTQSNPIFNHLKKIDSEKITSRRFVTVVRSLNASSVETTVTEEYVLGQRVSNSTDLTYGDLYQINNKDPLRDRGNVYQVVQNIPDVQRKKNQIYVQEEQRSLKSFCYILAAMFPVLATDSSNIPNLPVLTDLYRDNFGMHHLASFEWLKRYPFIKDKYDDDSPDPAVKQKKEEEKITARTLLSNYVGPNSIAYRKFMNNNLVYLNGVPMKWNDGHTMFFMDKQIPILHILFRTDERLSVQQHYRVYYSSVLILKNFLQTAGVPAGEPPTYTGKVSYQDSSNIVLPIADYLKNTRIPKSLFSLITAFYRQDGSKNIVIDAVAGTAGIQPLDNSFPGFLPETTIFIKDNSACSTRGYYYKIDPELELYGLENLELASKFKKNMSKARSDLFKKDAFTIQASYGLNPTMWSFKADVNRLKFNTVPLDITPTEWDISNLPLSVVSRLKDSTLSTIGYEFTESSVVKIPTYADVVYLKDERQKVSLMADVLVFKNRDNNNGELVGQVTDVSTISTIGSGIVFDERNIKVLGYTLDYSKIGKMTSRFNQSPHDIFNWCYFPELIPNLVYTAERFPETPIYSSFNNHNIYPFVNVLSGKDELQSLLIVHSVNKKSTAIIKQNASYLIFNGSTSSVTEVVIGENEPAQLLAKITKQALINMEAAWKPHVGAYEFTASFIGTNGSVDDLLRTKILTTINNLDLVPKGVSDPEHTYRSVTNKGGEHIFNCVGEEVPKTQETADFVCETSSNKKVLSSRIRTELGLTSEVYRKPREQLDYCWYCGRNQVIKTRVHSKINSLKISI